VTKGNEVLGKKKKKKKKKIQGGGGRERERTNRDARRMNYFLVPPVWGKKRKKNSPGEKRGKSFTNLRIHRRIQSPLRGNGCRQGKRGGEKKKEEGKKKKRRKGVPGLHPVSSKGAFVFVDGVEQGKRKKKGGKPR